MKRKLFLAGVAVLAVGSVFVTGGGAATVTTNTLTVNSTADSATPCTIVNHQSTGTCTLRGAILKANSVGTDNTMFVIKLAAKTYHLSLGELDIDASTADTANIVQLVGKTKTVGPKKHRHKVPASIIDGAGNAKPSRVFDVWSPTQMYNLVIQKGSGDGGGGIFVSSSLDLQSSIVKTNTSCSAWTGSSCTGEYLGGGGIQLNPSSTYHPVLTLYKTTVTGNKAGWGGGIDFENRNHTTVYILKSHIDKNVACKTFSHGVCVGDGVGGGIYDAGETMTIERSTVNGNVAGSPVYSTGDYTATGGGIYTDGAAAALQLINTTVSYNVAGEYGGGIDDESHLDLVNSTVSHNIAGQAGGGINVEYLLTSKNSTIANNTAGGVFACTIKSSTTTCKRTTELLSDGCKVLYPSATDCTQYNGAGGGIFADFEYPQLVGTTVTKNIAVTAEGGEEEEGGGCAGGQGGGVWNAWAWTATAGSKITNNTADCGGGIYNAYSSFSGTYTFVLNNSLISGNRALTDGGGIWTGGSGSATLYGMTITGNHAAGRAGGIYTDQLGAVLLGPGNKIMKNTSKGPCKNIRIPCK